MRMQLKIIIATCISFVLVANLFGQSSNDSTKVKLDNIEVSFLMSYYSQDGKHSPVTGGLGTEELTNTAPSIVLNIPIDTVRSLSVNAGIDVYSSASSDNINNPLIQDNHVSSASAQDARAYAIIGYKKKYNKKKLITGLDFGVSNEYDVNSLSFGASVAKSSADKNREISFKGSYYYDKWRLIFPVELRNGDVNYLKDDVRQSFNFTLTGTSIINQKLTASISSDFVYQTGLLSTPFHRVYFQELNTDQPRVEQLPDNRMKVPVGFRANYYLTDWMIVNSFYRFYWDSWDMIGNTFELELPIKLSQSFRVYPFFRYHNQTAAKYFGEYKTHSISDEFYTSDFDLSELSSTKYGMGISFDPLYGLFRFRGIRNKENISMLKSIDFRYAYYDRSDGLTASVITFGLNFSFAR